MEFGKWKINVSESYPQKVATALGQVEGGMLGADYEGVLYLGSQLVSGINHAVLAEQTILDGRDTHNAVILIFNERPGYGGAAWVGTERLLEDGAPLGGMKVQVTTEIPADVQETWDNAFETYDGGDVKPIAYLGNQLVNGEIYVLLGVINGKRLVLVTIDAHDGVVWFDDPLKTAHERSVSYAHTYY